MTNSSRLRVEIFKKQIEDSNLSILKSSSDEELLKILDASVLPNALDSKAVRYGFLFHLVFLERDIERKTFLSQINKLYNLVENLTKTEKILIKFGILKGFLSKNWRTELYRFISIPLAISSNSSGRKIISSPKFKEIFYFIYNLVKRGKNNEQFPRF